MDTQQTTETPTIQKALLERKSFYFIHKPYKTETKIKFLFDDEIKIDSIEFNDMGRDNFHMNVSKVTDKFIYAYTYILNHEFKIQIPLSAITFHSYYTKQF